MNDSLEECLSNLRKDRTLFLSGEAATKQAVILPILARLGWDVFNVREVVPEFQLGDSRVDFCLRLGERNALFLEVKRVNEDLEQHQEQLLEYAFRGAVQIAVLTNGLSWWLYLPLLEESSWEQRKFFVIDIQEQDLSSAVQHFREFLEKEAIASGKAVERARALHQGKEKERTIKTAIPRAWDQLLQEPDEQLLKLIADRVEKLCGHRPEDQILAEFLTTRISLEPSLGRTPEKSPPILQMPPGPRRARLSAPGRQQQYTHTKPTEFSFGGERRAVSTYKEILLGVCEILRGAHPRELERVLSLRGRKRDYFSRDFKAMQSPKQIAGTGVYVETNLSANSIVSLCDDLLALFGHRPSELKIEFRDR